MLVRRTSLFTDAVAAPGRGGPVIARLNLSINQTCADASLEAWSLPYLQPFLTVARSLPYTAQGPGGGFWLAAGAAGR